MAGRESGVPAGWPAPLRLLATLLGPEPLAASALPPLDDAGWETFARLVIERHRVAPAICAALDAAGLEPPRAVGGTLAAEAGANAWEALALKAETVRILRAFAAFDCRPMVLKGWPLAEELAGSAALRQARDLDLHVPAEAVEACCTALGELGYSVAPEHRGRLPLIGSVALMTECNDIAFADGEGRTVELHWRLGHFRGWPDLADLDGAARNWPLDGTGIGVPVPGRPANLVYLALHGQQHAWLRLKWLHDIALAMRVYAPGELDEALALARRVRAARALVTAVHLAARVFAAPLPPGWPGPDRRSRRMVERFLAGIAADDAAPGSLRARFAFYWSGLVMAQGTAQRLGVLRYAFLRGPRLYLAGWRPDPPATATAGPPGGHA